MTSPPPKSERCFGCGHLKSSHVDGKWCLGTIGFGGQHRMDCGITDQLYRTDNCSEFVPSVGNAEEGT